jgi:amino acid adenylation domain-containing protein/FkbH-like protein
VFGQQDTPCSPPSQDAISWLRLRLGEALDVDPAVIDLDRSLAAHGLDSLSAIELQAALERDLGILVEAGELLTGGSLRELAAAVAARLDAAAAGLPPGRDAPAPPPAAASSPADAAGGEVPLSFGQQGLWLLHRLAPASAAYHLTGAVRIQAAFDDDDLRWSLAELAARHAVLRSVFLEEGGTASARLAAVELVADSLRSESAELWSEAEVAAELAAAAARPLDLERGAVLRVVRLRRAPGESLLLLVVHHIVADFRSLAILLEELALLLAARRRHVPCLLPPLTLGYGEYAERQRRELAGPAGGKLWEFWQRQLAGDPPPLQLPADGPRPAVRTFHGDTVYTQLDPGVTDLLRQVARGADVTLHSAVMALFALLLLRSGGQQEVLVGSPADSRTRPELAGVVGYFANPLVVRTRRPPPALTGAGLLHAVHRTVLAALDHRELPLALLAERLHPARDSQPASWFDAVLVLHRERDAASRLLAALAVGRSGLAATIAGLRLESLAVTTRSAAFDLSLTLAELDGRLLAAWNFADDYLDRGTVVRMAAAFSTLAGQLAADPAAAASALPLLTAGERFQLVVEWNDTAPPAGGEPCLHRLFETQARRTPDAAALIVGQLHISYRQLDELAERLARRLRCAGATPEARVGVLLDRSPELVPALLGILKAGAAYVPLDPAYPTARLAFMAADADVGAVVCRRRDAEGELRRHLPAAVQWLPVDLAPAVLAGGSGAAPPAAAGAVDPDQLAYVIYTSGSTGRPKGVALAHRGAAALLGWARRAYTERELAAVLAATSISFDLSLFEIFAPLACGGTVVLARDVFELPALPAASRITLINTVPAAMAELLRASGLPASVRVANLAGEPLARGLAERLYRDTAVDRVVNLYGPSEDTTYSTWAVIDRHDPRPPSIGAPIAGGRVHLLDAAFELVPIGVAGELCLGGSGLARGYWARPDLTAERFVPDAESGEPGARLYRTGDLGRRRPAGTLEFLGRTDHQVKIRGFRIEPGEIAAVLGEHPRAAGAAVVAGKSPSGEALLVAYVAGLAGARLDAAELAAWLACRVPGYMLPAVFVQLDALPLSPNGKLDRLRLPAPAFATLATAPGALPRTPVEELLAALWSELLQVPAVCREDDFFALGGHSIKASQLAARVQAAFACPFELRQVFAGSSLAAMARQIEAARQPAAPPAGSAPIPPPPPGEPVPLAPAQRWLWTLARLDPGSAVYNMPAAVDLEGELDVPALRTAWNHLLWRHEILRTSFPSAGGRTWQQVSPVPPPGLPLLDLSALPAPARVRLAAEHTAAAARRPFDLESGPLLRAALLRSGPAAHTLLLAAHHMVADGGSVELFLRELAQAYGCLRAGSPPDLPGVPIQYGAFAAWQWRQQAGGRAEEALAYWRRTLHGAALLDLPADRPPAPIASRRGAVVRLPLAPALGGTLAELGRGHGASLLMTLLAGCAALLARYTGQTDIVVGLPVALRDRPETARLIGLCVHLLPVRVAPHPAASFAALLAAVREAVLGAWEHRELPWQELIERLELPSEVRGQLEPRVAFDLERPLPEIELPGLQLATRQLETGTAKFELTLCFAAAGSAGAAAGPLTAACEYRADRFDPPTACRLLGHLSSLLAAAAANPHARLAGLPLLSAAERAHLLIEWGRSAVAAPPDPLPVHRLFAGQAASRPDAVAVVAADLALTYGDLDRRAGRLALRLQALGVGPECVVALLLDRSADYLVAILAVLKAGGAYLPLDPASPPRRLDAMIAGAGARILLARDGDRRIPRLATAPGTPEIVQLDPGAAAAMPEVDSGDGPAVAGAPAGPGNLAYLIFTSGSTGAPKAVAVEHASLSNLVAWHRQRFAVTPRDRASQLASLAFDASVWEVWPYLASGACLELPPDDMLSSAPRLAGWLAGRAVTIAFLPTPMLEVALPHLAGRALALRHLLTGGDRLRQRSPPGLYCPLVNHYGPSECAVVATSGVVTPAAAGPPPLGRPIAGVRLALLDGNGALVPVGVAGEIHLGGRGLARGYHGRPDLTADRFRPDPLQGDGSRLYRTGDLARYRAQGELEFLGRTDRQVKIRGVRIEIGEVEAALVAHPGVAAAVVTAGSDGAGGPLLTAYVVPAAAGPLDTASLLESLVRRLPAAMIPAAIVPLAELPRTANGKIDLAALPAAADHPRSRRQPQVAPRTPLEETLAAIWRQLLAVESVGVRDNFFALGGNSLQVIRLLTRVHELLGVELTLAGLESAPTIEQLAAAIADVRAAAAASPAAPAAERIRRRPDPGERPLSHAQERLWFLWQLEPASPAYNVASAVRLRGPLAWAALARGLAAVGRRHQVLRTAYGNLAGQPVCRPPAAVTVGLPLVDLTPLPGGRRRVESDRLACQLGRLAFDLGKPPLLRACLLRHAPCDHLLALVLHHIVADAWSLAILVEELAVLYGAVCNGGEPRLPELAIDYCDFAAWQRQWLTPERIAGEIAAARQALAATPALDLPTDQPRPAVRDSRGALLPVRIESWLGERLEQVSRDAGATPFTLLLAAFAALLGRYSDQEDFAVGSPIAGRARPEVAPLVGCFANTLALRVDLSGDPSFRRLIDRLWQVRTAAAAHQELPFEKLVEHLAPERSLARPPLFQVMLAYEEEAVEPALPGLQAAVHRIDTGTAKFDLTLALARGRRDPGLRGGIEYSTALFAATTVSRMAGHYLTLLAAALSRPATPLSQLPLLSPAQRHQLLLETAAAGAAAAPGGSAAAALHQLFEAQAAAVPDRVALSRGDQRVTYGELNRRANRLARRLRRHGVGVERLVGILLEREPAAVEAVLATLKAGGAYLPLDPRYPGARTARMLADAEVQVVLTRRRFAAGLPPRLQPAVLAVDDPGTASTAPPAAGDLGLRLPAAALAYVIYTSGSTGAPKGVALTHRGALQLMAWARSAFSPAELEEVLATTSFCFDLAVFELFAPLSHGGAVRLADDAVQPDAAGGRPTLLNTVPSVMAELVRAGGVAASITTVNLAGEPLPRSLVEQIHAASSASSASGASGASGATAATAARRVLNLYGPTEDTTYSTWLTVEPGGSGPVALGEPLPGTRVCLLDRRLEPVPLGVPGELCLASGSLARGYLGRPDLTAERFLPDPWSAAPGQRLYRTGDLALRRPDGRLEFRGRIDQQIKVRGFRIEPGEIEAALCRLAGVAEAAVVAVGDAGGERRLIGLMVPAAVPPPSLEEVRRQLRRALPEPMVPAALAWLEAMPRTTTGKLDRAALQRTAGTALLPAVRGTAPPRTPVEQLLAGIWEQLLGVAGIGAADSFFELGGHSLLAVRMAARVREDLGAALTVNDVFAAPTVAALAAKIEAGLGGGGGASTPLVRRAPGSEAPLSFAQERLWFLERLAPQPALYNMPAALELTGAVQVAALRHALAEVLRRHEVLRAVFAEAGGRPVQRFLPPAPPRLAIAELSGLPAAARAAEAERLAAAAAVRPFDLRCGPLLRAVLLRLDSQRSALLLTLHHIAFDGGSSAILLAELAALYDAASRRLASPLPELPLQYADFAAWQRAELTGEVLARLLAHWRERLAGAPAWLALPTDRPRGPANRPARGGRRPVELDERCATLLRDTCRQLNVTPFMALATTLAAVLGRYSGSRDLLLGFPITDRGRRELEPLIGIFVNTLPLRAELAGDPTVAELLHRIRRTALDAYAHQELPFDKLVLELQPRRALDRSPLVQVLMAYQHETPAARLPGLAVARLAGAGRELAGAKFDLTWSLTDDGRQIAGALDFARDLFDAATVERLRGHLLGWLGAACRDHRRRLSEVEMLAPAERWQMLVEWNQSGPAPAGCRRLEELVAAQVLATPAAVALVCGDEALSYGELGRRRDRLLAALVAAGVEPGDRVAVCLRRRPDWVAAVLAILAAGGAYVPLAADDPAARLAFLIGDAAPAMLVTEPSLAGRFDAAGGAGGPLAGLPQLPRLSIDGPGPLPGGSAPPRPPAGAAAGGGAAAYLIYTSGSTGRPKGVVVSHAAAVNRLLWSQSQVPLTPADRVLQGAAPSFDFSLWEIFAPLLAGASLTLPEPQAGRDVAGQAELIAERQLTVAHFVPSALRALVDGGKLERCTSLRLLLSGGEALAADLHDRLLAGLSEVWLYNQYGPTETTIDSTFWRCRAAAAGQPVPIGRPIAGTVVYLLDDDLQPVPIGAAGELHIGGAGVALGYLGRPALTAERFLPDAWSGVPGARLYRTGDLGCHRPEGALRYLGRRDGQVKVRGFRIETGEIDAALGLHPAIRQAATVAREDVPGVARLVSYVVPQPAAALPGADELRRFLAARLPEPMLPAAFVALPALPLLATGKLDRAALPPPGQKRPALGSAYVAPRDPIEELLAGIWADLLEIEQVGVEDDFFALGGHSLLTARLAARIRDAFAVELPLAALFEQPTVAGLAALLAAAARRAGPTDAGVRPGGDRAAAGSDSLPLSFSQQRLWLLQQAFPGSSAYHVPGAVRLRGRLAPAALAWSLAEIVRRHAVLRTVFPSAGGEPFQSVGAASPLALPLPLTCLAGLPEGRRQEEARRLGAAAARQPFALATGPLYRALLLRLAPAEHLLLLTVHHIAFDGHSLVLLLEELAALYAAAARGVTSPLAAPALQFADFAVWQRRQMSGERLAGHLLYFRDALAGAPPLVELPADRPRPPRQSLRGAATGTALSAAEGAALRAFSQRHGLTPFMVLLAAFAKLLLRWTGQGDLVVGTVVANRDRPELAGLIGCCINFLPLRLTAAGEQSGSDLLAGVRAAALAAYAHQDCPFELVVEALNPQRRPDCNPIYNTGILLQRPPRLSHLGDGVELELVPAVQNTALLDLRLVAQTEDAGLRLDLEYATDLFDEATAAQLLAAYATALAGLWQLPAAPLAAWSPPPALAALAAAAPAHRQPSPALVVGATFTAEPLLRPLGFWMEQLGLPYAVELAPYNQLFQQLLDSASRMARNAGGINVALIRLEDWLPGPPRRAAGDAAAAPPPHAEDAALAVVERTAHDLLAALRSYGGGASSPCLVCFGPSSPSAPDEPLRRIERWLCGEIARLPGVHAAGSAELADLYPVAEPFDPWSDRAGHIPYTPPMWNALAALAARRIYALTSPPYKVIALDCDQTLWRGVCGEDGPQGVELDAGRRTLQELMVAQHDAGMLLCLCSKNNAADVDAVFAHHPEMPLRPAHFVARRVNWRPKSENLRALAAQLGLGLDSFILVDDSPAECLEVETACPQVLALTLPAAPQEIAAWFKHQWAFDRLAPTAEDQRRNDLYRQHLEREAWRAEAPALADFIASLEVEVEIAPAAPQDLPRLAQLTQRTNQFNLSGRRRSEAEIAALAAAGRHCLKVAVRDRFGDYGLVGAVIYALAGAVMTVDTLLLSCRVLGRGVEHRVLAHLGEIALAAGAARVELPFVPTARNQPLREFLEEVAAPAAAELPGFFLAAGEAARTSLAGAVVTAAGAAAPVAAGAGRQEGA